MGDIRLSNREVEILHMVAQRVDNRTIAEKLKTSRESIDVYIHNIRRKLGLSDRRAMMALSHREIEGYRKPATRALTERENEVAIFVAQGLSNEQIGRALCPKIKASSVDKHIQNIFEKLGIASRVKLAIYAVKTGLIQLDDIELS